MEGRYFELDVKWHHLPLQGLIVLDVADLDQMQRGVGHLEEVKERLGLEKVFGLDAEGVLLEQAIRAEEGRICWIWTLHALVLVQGKGSDSSAFLHLVRVVGVLLPSLRVLVEVFILDADELI